MTSRPRRLHRSGILLSALRTLREAALPLLLAFVAGIGTRGPTGDSALMLAVMGVALAVGVGYVRWATTLWWVTEGGVHFRSGLLSPNETVVPKSRIQAIDTTQGPVQRLFGVLEVQVQTAAGGSSAEIGLSAVSPADALALRAAVGLPEPGHRDIESVTLGTGALMVTALTAPQLGILVPIIAAAATVGDDLLTEGLRSGWFEQVPEGAAVVLAVTVAGLGVWLLSLIGSVIAFAGFTAERDAERLRIRRGLAQRRTASLPVARVHAVRIVEGVLRQPFGLASVRLETAGYRNEPAAAQTLFPLVRTRDVDALLGRLLPELGGALGDLAAPPPRARRRYVLPGTLMAGGAGATLAATQPAAWPVAVALGALAAVHGLLRFRAAGWRLAEGRVVVRSRAVARHTLVARVTRLQEHSVVQTALQRPAALAHVELAVGSGRRAAVAHLELQTARSLFDDLRLGAYATAGTAGPGRGEGLGAQPVGDR